MGAKKPYGLILIKQENNHGGTLSKDFFSNSNIYSNDWQNKKQ
ncbi:MAG: hypothetical protein UR26_C0002G0132 [candidate division TM6 bacterium GW2011_GWF2_32_72]|nr:MAG: hypothetical protein UR26_C0002G0132 [candidate division TM6 bacterium GW2011_GWF2_32_72]